MYRALKSFDHDELGRIKKGQEFKATPAQIGGIKAFIEEYDTKVLKDQAANNKSATANKDKSKK